MFKLQDAEGVTREVEGIDINVWNSNLYGNGPARGIVCTGYPMAKDADGDWVTDDQTILFSAETNFDVSEYEDEWYGFSDDNTPADVPFEVNTLVNNILAEVSL